MGLSSIRVPGHLTTPLRRQRHTAGQRLPHIGIARFGQHSAGRIGIGDREHGTGLRSAETISLSTSGLPSGASASFSPSSVGAGGSSNLTISTSASTPAGTYSVTITGSAASASHSTTYSLTVTGTGGCSSPGQKLGNPGFESGSERIAGLSLCFALVKAERLRCPAANKPRRSGVERRARTFVLKVRAKRPAVGAMRESRRRSGEHQDRRRNNTVLALRVDTVSPPTIPTVCHAYAEALELQRLRRRPVVSWEAALQARREMASGSPVAVLDHLLREESRNEL